jgi:hypothetical protein
MMGIETTIPEIVREFDILIAVLKDIDLLCWIESS